MPQSLVKNYLHLVFSTKHRESWLDDDIQPEMFNYLGGILAALECNPVQIGGYADHIHALFLLSRKMAPMDVVEEIKTQSSKWIKTKGEQYKNFYWQHGYGAFSVNAADIAGVVNYIKNQKAHHTTRTFQNEFRGIMEKYKMDYDERYVWD